MSFGWRVGSLCVLILSHTNERYPPNEGYQFGVRTAPIFEMRIEKGIGGLSRECPGAGPEDVEVMGMNWGNTS